MTSEFYNSDCGKIFCLFCYKALHYDSVSVNGDGQEVSEMKLKKCHLFYQHVYKPHPFSHAPTTFRTWKEAATSTGTTICMDCLYVVDAHNEIFHEIACLKMKLQWQQDRLWDVMKSAGRVPSRLKAFLENLKIARNAQLCVKMENETHDGNDLNAILKIRQQIFRKLRMQTKNPRIHIEKTETADNARKSEVKISSNRDSCPSDILNIGFKSDDINIISNTIDTICNDEESRPENPTSPDIVSPEEIINKENGNASLPKVDFEHNENIENGIIQPSANQGMKQFREISECTRTFSVDNNHVDDCDDDFNNEDCQVNTSTSEEFDNDETQASTEPVDDDTTSDSNAYKQQEDIGIQIEKIKHEDFNRQPWNDDSMDIDPNYVSDSEDTSSVSSEDINNKPDADFLQQKPKFRDVSNIKKKRRNSCPHENCYEHFLTSAGLKLHLNLHGQFYCNFCDFSSDFADKLISHEFNSHSLVRNEDGLRANCPRCKKSLSLHSVKKSRQGLPPGTLKHYYIQHLDIFSQAPEVIKCTICQKIFYPFAINIRQLMDNHMKSFHDFTGRDPKSLFKCNLCSAKFLLHMQLRLHLRTVHKEKKFKCDECHKLFLRQNCLEKHRRKEHTEGILREFKCTVSGCARAFLEEFSLSKHMEIHQGKKEMVQCEICAKLCMNVHSLKSHMIMHDPPKKKRKITYQVVCDKCGKCFVGHSMKEVTIRLEVHLKSFLHDGSKMWEYSCELCGKPCQTLFKLEEHTRTHTGEKPFLCTYCGREFSVQFNLKRHMKTVHKVFPDKQRNRRIFIDAHPNDDSDANKNLDQDV